MPAGARAAAKARGEKHYFTGKLCKHGHIAKRLVKTGKCAECVFPSAHKHGEYNARWKAKYPGREQIVKYRHRHRYGVELDQIRPKPAHCEICGKEHRKIVLDHCHKTGAFRGWLCDPCNIALGIVADDEAILMRMIAYLRGELVQGFTLQNNDVEKRCVGQSKGA